MKNYLQKLKFTSLTEVQQKILSIPKTSNLLIVSPTGSGKTEAIYNLLLNQNKKTIIVQPMRTLSTSIYNRLDNYNSKLNLPSWSLQHSTLPNDKFLDNKYCVTTIDQVLSGWLGIGKQSFIRGKNVVSSNLFFDEVQLFEPNKTFLTTINMLDSIFKLNTNNFTIMTATMPQYLIDFLANRYNMYVIICNEESIQNRNVNINYTPELNFNIVNKTQKKQIVICNTQTQQEDILNQIKDKKRCLVLNSKLLNTDRKKIEEKVYKYFGKNSNDNNKILITTQIVEAGIDISADLVYSASAPIDNLVQRAGRCSRWGGDGIFTVFYTKDLVYDKNIVNDTISLIEKNNGNTFDWCIQKQWINDILNKYYEEIINPKSIKINKANLLNNKRNELIRDVRNVNIIVQNTTQGVHENMFEMESVSIDIRSLKKLKDNEFYILEKGIVKSIDYWDINIGDLVVINNKNCVYDVLGFRIQEDAICKVFKYNNNQNNNNSIYEKYINEPLLCHSLLVKECVTEAIQEYTNIEYMKNNKENICDILGLHDIGKADEKWVEWSNSKDVILSHFPFTKQKFLHKNRKHSHISAKILSNHCDTILFNTLLQHHGREVYVSENLFISEYKLDKKTKQLLNHYGFNKDVEFYNKDIIINENEIMNPTSKDWNIFLILTGILMESDIKAIKKYIQLS